jgi:DNA-binding transcriptional ArsR family regulator
MSEAIATLRALADPIRIEILDRISSGRQVTATQLADVLPITRQAVGKHVRTLESAGLVVGRRAGREHRLSVDLTTIRAATDWLTRREASWDDALQRLARYLEA